MRRFTAQLMVGAALVVVPATLLASGFSISEFDSRASGRGYAATTLYDSPSAVFYNSANVSRLEGLQLNVGMAGIMPRFKYLPTDLDKEARARSNVGITTPPSLSITYGLGEVGLGNLAVGFGMYVPYGSVFSWPDDWEGRQQLQELGLTVFELCPVVSWRPHERFAVGAGFRYDLARVYLRRAVGFGSEAEGDVEMSGSGGAPGASVGLSFWPMDGISLALTYRSPVEVRLKGESDFSFPPPFDTSAMDRPVRTRVPLAQTVRLGVGYDIIPQKLNFGVDVEYAFWSAYDELRIAFKNPDGTNEVLAEPKDSRNTITIHSGVEYRIVESFAIRAGYVFDQHSQPEETVGPAPPDSDKHVVSVGASYFWNQLGFHAHFMNAFFAPRESLTSDFPAQWEGGYPFRTMGYLFGVSVSAAFDVAPALGSGTGGQS